MTTKQVHAIYDLIQEVFKREGKSSQALHRLVGLADDQRPADWQDCHGVYPKSDTGTVQPQVTTTTSSSSVPTPPSTPQPTGFDYKKSLLEGEKSTTLRMYMGAVEMAKKLQIEVESLKEVIGSQDGKIASLKESVENRTKTIEMLKNQIELLTKRIKDDREHWDGCREHNNELVAANAEIYQSLRHWGLEQSEPCSLVNNVKQVIQLCAERGKEIEAMLKEELIDQTEIDYLNHALDVKETELLQASDNVAKLRYEKDAKIEALEIMIGGLGKQVDNMKRFARDDRDILHRKTLEIDKLKYQMSVIERKYQHIIKIGGKVADQLKSISAEYHLHSDELKKSQEVCKNWDLSVSP